MANTETIFTLNLKAILGAKKTHLIMNTIDYLMFSVVVWKLVKNNRMPLENKYDFFYDKCMENDIFLYVLLDM